MKTPSSKKIISAFHLLQHLRLNLGLDLSIKFLGEPMLLYTFSVLCNQLLPGDQSINLFYVKQPKGLFMLNLNTHLPQCPH